MSEYISKDYLHDKLSACKLEFLEAHKYARAEGVGACIAIVFDAPTIKDEPTKRGRWITDGAGILDRCSVCYGAIKNQLFKPPFCPYCGAKMDERRKDGNTD